MFLWQAVAPTAFQGKNTLIIYTLAPVPQQVLKYTNHQWFFSQRIQSNLGSLTGGTISKLSAGAVY
ncbi:MAG: hypothetical protein IPL42_09585 [Saprospiraceae bacterium]|nr:hypothetical protein [Saprospiraceae bacterium]